MKTSYFGNRAAAGDPQAVSIARWWGPRRRYIALAPSADLLRRAKAGLPWPDYVTEYRSTVLDKLDPSEIYSDLIEDY